MFNLKKAIRFQRNRKRLERIKAEIETRHTRGVAFPSREEVERPELVWKAQRYNFDTTHYPLEADERKFELITIDDGVEILTEIIEHGSDVPSRKFQNQIICPDAGHEAP